MYWIGSRSIFVFALFSSLLVASCSTNEAKQVEEKVEVEETPKALTEEEYIARLVENELKITAAEEYDIEIFYKHLDPDTLMDAVILVNRKDFAFKHVRSNNSEGFFERTGYTGPYNYVFVKLGGKKTLISTTPVGSNVHYPLDIHFLELTSMAHTDFYVDYRINNSLQRNYYTIRGNDIHLTFSCPVYDEVGEKNPVVYHIEHPTSTVRLSKDIAMYHASFEGYNPAEIEDVNAYEPKGINKTDDLYVYFIFDDKTMKYKTPMQAPETEE